MYICTYTTIFSAHCVYIVQAKQVYSLTKYKMEETREALEKKLQEHKAALHKLRVLEKHQDQLSKSHKEAVDLLRAIEPFNSDLMDRKERALSKSLSSSAVGLIVAGATLYAAPLCPAQQRTLFDGWILYCRGLVEPGELDGGPSQAHTSSTTPRIPMNDAFSITGVFAEDDFTEKLFSCDSQEVHVVTERLILTKFLATSPSTLIPLVFDPSGYLQTQTPYGNTRRLSTEIDSVSNHTSQRRSSSRLSFSRPNEILSPPGVFTDSHTLPPHTPAGNLSPEDVELMLDDLGMTVLSFKSAEELRPDIVQVLKEHLNSNNPGDVVVVIFQDADVCMRGDELPVVLQTCLQQTSRLSCSEPWFTVVNLEMGQNDVMEYFRQKIISSLAPTFHSRYRAMIADITTHINSIKHIQVQICMCDRQST